MKCVDYCGEHHIKKLKNFVEKKNSKAKKPSKSTYNPVLQVDYPLFQKSVQIGFVLLSIPTTMQNFKKIPSESFRGNRVTNGRTNGRTNGGEIKGPLKFHPGPISSNRDNTQ